MTLNREIKVPDYSLRLKYHNSRPPDEAMVEKISESLRLAREIANEAVTRLGATFGNPESQDTLAREVAQYHFKVDANSPIGEREQIVSVIGKTAAGLNSDMTLSDALNKYAWDDYKIYRDGLSP